MNTERYIDFETILRIQEILNKSKLNDNTLFYYKKEVVTIKVYRNLNDTDIYKTIKIRKSSGIYTVVIFPERIKRIINLESNDLEDIFTIIEKQMNVKEFTRVEIDQIKQTYKEGTRIELIKMYDLRAVPSGTKGRVFCVDDLGTIHIIWENGSTLGLNLRIDKFKII